MVLVQEMAKPAVMTSQTQPKEMGEDSLTQVSVQFADIFHSFICNDAHDELVSITYRSCRNFCMWHDPISMKRLATDHFDRATASRATARTTFTEAVSPFRNAASTVVVALPTMARLDFATTRPMARRYLVTAARKLRQQGLHPRGTSLQDL